MNFPDRKPFASSTRRIGSSTSSKKSRRAWIYKVLMSAVGIMVLGYGALVLRVIRYSQDQDTQLAHSRNRAKDPFHHAMMQAQLQRREQKMAHQTTEQVQQQQQQQPQRLRPPDNASNKPSRNTFDDWKQLAVDLAKLPPSEILYKLEHEDPFGVRSFETRLLDLESSRQAILNMEDIENIFPCPTTSRITLPDIRNHTRANWYRQGLETQQNSHIPFMFLFFQHLRKAGGTNFCSLAQHNLPKPQVPSYYCMPDYYWKLKDGRQSKCAGCFSKYDTPTIAGRMLEADHRILGNEWDSFEDRFFELPAIYATSFRRPLDRALSQFRFECIEDRGCKVKNVTEWWHRRKDLYNVYTWTFSKEHIRPSDVDGSSKHVEKRQSAMKHAMETIQKYHLILVMEWLAYAPGHTKDVLGYKDMTTMTERVRPHIGQAKREDGQQVNKLGAAGIAKASWTPKEYLSPTQYTRMSEDLALDEILTDAARRMFLERIVCQDMKEPQ